MALLYHNMKHIIETSEAVIRRLEDDDNYCIAITFTPEEDEDGTVEVLLTDDEVSEAYDLIFNK